MAPIAVLQVILDQTAQSLGESLLVLHPPIWAVCPILCGRSSQAPSGWMGTAISRSCDRCSKGFKSGSWLDPSSQRFSLKPFLALFCLYALGHCLQFKIQYSKIFIKVMWALEQVFLKDLSIHSYLYPTSCTCCWETLPKYGAAITMLQPRDGISHMMSRTWCSQDTMLRGQILSHQTRECYSLCFQSHLDTIWPTPNVL